VNRNKISKEKPNKPNKEWKTERIPKNNMNKHLLTNLKELKILMMKEIGNIGKT